MKISSEEQTAYEQKLKEWHEYMDGIKPTPEKYGYESFGLEFQGGWQIEGGEEAYYKALAEWKIKRSCDAPNPPGYYRANND